MSHPNIINIYGYAADAEQVYLLLEPCLGSNMYQKIIKEPIKEK
jgi:serine/threonine protein kinase